MREINVFCDLCKKKIDDYKYNFLWKTGYVRLEYERLGFSSNEEVEIKDICRDCAQEIHDFVESLKKSH